MTAIGSKLRRDSPGYRSDPVDRIRAQQRRDTLKAQGLCLNGPKHGRATHGVLCKRCRTQHTLSA